MRTNVREAANLVEFDPVLWLFPPLQILGFDFGPRKAQTLSRRVDRNFAAIEVWNQFRHRQLLRQRERRCL